MDISVLNIPQWDTSNISHIIEIAIAPVFLLTGVAGFLMVMINRLARIIDRARALPKKIYRIKSANHRLVIDQEMNTLLYRSRLINISISLATTSALLVCLVIMILFMGSLLSMNIAKVLAILFVICMALLIMALSLFLAEIFIATRSMRAGMATIEWLLHPGADRSIKTMEELD